MRFMMGADVNRKTGFTLLEVAIVLLISGILFSIGIMAYDLYSKNQKYAQTWKNMETIRNALAEYQIKTGFFPCPANPALGPADTGYGDASPACNPCPGCVVLGGRDADGKGGTDRVIIGSIPLTTLIRTVYSDNIKQAKLSINDAHDGWGNKIMYAVSENLTPSYTGGVFKPTNGSVDIVDENGQALLAQDYSAHYALISYGQDANGAYSHDGAVVAACNPGQAETPNCALSAQLVSGLISMAPGTTYYDDLVQYVTWTASKMWSYSQESPGTVYNTDLGNVGMGTNTPLNQLDVGGRIQTTNIFTRLFCDANGNNCYDPKKIGGTESTMNCNNNRMAVKQIGVNATGVNGSLNPSESSVGCQRPFPSAAALNKQCATGYMYGYTTKNGGEPLCN